MSAWPYAIKSIGAEGLHWVTTARERVAVIYQHEVRGADQASTRAIDSHVQAEQRGDKDDDGPADVLAAWANGR